MTIAYSTLIFYLLMTYGFVAYAKFKQEKSSLDEGLIDCSNKTQRWLKSANTIQHWEASKPKANTSSIDRGGLLTDIHHCLRTLYQLGTFAWQDGSSGPAAEDDAGGCGKSA